MLALVLPLLFVGCSCLEWPDHLEDPSRPVEVCAGDNIQLLWNFTLGPGEKVKGMVWTCHTDGQEEESDVMATYLSHLFVPSPHFSGRLTHLEGGGIEVSCATILESGNYSIDVTIEDSHNQQSVHSKRAMVTVIDAPKTHTGDLQVTVGSEPVFDEGSGGQWRVQLLCGGFSDVGHPPVDVIWTVPSGEERNSSGYSMREDGGYFHLLLPNPALGGNYTCRIRPSLSTRCIPGEVDLMSPAGVEVRGESARFAVMLARHQHELLLISHTQGQLQEAVRDLENTTTGLDSRLDEAIADAAPISFQARLSSNTALSSGNVLKLTNVLTNQGSAYDPSTGIFTAPLNGTYFFIATTGSYSSGSYANMYLMRDGSQVAQTYLLRDSNYYHMGSCHASLDLSNGSKVWLQSSASNSYFWSSVTSFSGYRV